MTAAITLSAIDAGSGVASTHWVLDGGADAVGMAVSTSVFGSHTLEFWSVDSPDDVEAQQTVTFSVIAPMAPPSSDPAPSQSPDPTVAPSPDPTPAPVPPSNPGNAYGWWHGDGSRSDHERDRQGDGGIGMSWSFVESHRMDD